MTGLRDTLRPSGTKVGATETDEVFTGNLAIPRYELEPWARDYGVVAGITGRGGGFDLNLWSRDSVGSVMTRWRAFRQTVGRQFPSVVLSHQRHGNEVAPVQQPSSGLLIRDGVDGHVTATPGIMLVVTVADCVPVYLLHVPSGGLGLLHAGWRGTSEKIVEKGVESLCELVNGQAADIIMHCGVSVCGKCYEVGPEVIESVTNQPAAEPGNLDLRDVLRCQGASLGLGSITSSGWCTAHHAEHFYSYRRSKGASGRMVAYVGRPLA